MCDDNIQLVDFEELGDESENEATLFSLSTEYFEAASVLINTIPAKINFSLVTFFLLGHATELALKSFLFNTGETADTLRNIGHNLDRLIKTALDKGLKLISYNSISQLSDIYRGQDLKYRKNEKIIYPQLRDLFEEVKSLHSMVFNHLN